VPCSNTGVLGKRPEARWRISPSEIAELAAQQSQLLESACRRLRPGGRLVYSTCSIEPEENEQIVRGLLRQEPALSLVEEWHQIPGQPSDGGYQALLVRNPSESVAEDPQTATARIDETE
jgi:16S rRNA (cytosine967-C5)-methyltransferase